MTCQFCNSPLKLGEDEVFTCGSFTWKSEWRRTHECQLGEKIMNLTKELSESNKYSRRLNLKIADLCKERDEWKNIASEMFSALRMCMTCLKMPPGSAGFIANTETRDMKHWRDIVADAMEKFPGCTVDREVYYALDLPKRQRDAALRKKRLT